MITWSPLYTRLVAAMTVLLIIFYMSIGQNSNINPRLQMDKDNKPSTQLINVTRKEFNANGDLDTSIISPKINIFDIKGISIISKPELNTFNQRENQWTLTSDTAKIKDKYNTIELINNVTATHEIKTTIIKSHYIEMEKDTQNISSNKPIQLIKEHSKLQAVGLDGNLKTHYLHLKSQVKGQYYENK